MATEPTETEGKKIKVKVQGGASDTVYGLGFIGAMMYYMPRATTTQEKIKAFFKAFIWPVTLVHDLFKFLNPEKPEE